MSRYVSPVVSRVLVAGLALVATAALAAGCAEGPGRAGDGIGEPVVPAPGEGTTPGGGPDAGAVDPPPVPAGTDDLRRAVRLYADALLTGRAGPAYALYTDACRDRVDRTAFGDLVARAGELYGEPLAFAAFSAEGADADEVGDRAEVDYTLRGARGLVQEDETWELTADGWRLADC